MLWVRAAICWASRKESDWFSDAGIDWPLVIGADFSCRHCSCCAGFGGVVAKLREREIRRSATKCTGDTQKKGRREQFNATSCGRSWITRGTNSGFGLRSMRTHVKSLAFTLGHATKPQPASCGNPCLRYIANVQLLTPIFGQPTQQFYQASGIVRSAKRRARPAILSDSTTRSDNGCLDWCEKPCPFLSRWKITLVPFGILCITTMHHYLFSTTRDTTI